MIISVLYILVGILSNFFGSVSALIKKEFSHDEMILGAYAMTDQKLYGKQRMRFLFFKIFFRMLAALFFPIFYILVILDHFKFKEKIMSRKI